MVNLVLFIGMGAFGLAHLIAGVRNGIIRKRIQASVSSSRIAVGREAVATGTIEAAAGAFFLGGAMYAIIQLS
jgi:hypothetical protein